MDLCFVSLKSRIWIFGIVLSLTNIWSSNALQSPYLQAVHILDPEIGDFKYYNSWNSDKWIHWLRDRYLQNDVEKRANKEITPTPLYGLWVNIIVVASAEEINSAFSELSTPTYTDGSRLNYYWSDTPFSVFAIVRQQDKENGTILTEYPVNEEVKHDSKSQYNVFNCADKKMYLNAKVDPVTFHPILIQTFFPKKVKNPKDTLRIPLGVCKKVSQVRGLLDEIKFQLGN